MRSDLALPNGLVPLAPYLRRYDLFLDRKLLAELRRTVQVCEIKLGGQVAILADPDAVDRWIARKATA